MQEELKTMQGEKDDVHHAYKRAVFVVVGQVRGSLFHCYILRVYSLSYICVDCTIFLNDFSLSVILLLSPE